MVEWCASERKFSKCLLFLFLIYSVVVKGEQENQATDLPDTLIRGPLLHEHSFAAPIVTDWWEEGVPHFMIGGSAVANENFIRLTTNNLGDHGFAFNTAPCDHTSWEARLRFSIRAPLPVMGKRREEQEKYQGGEGMALWYLEQPLGDDHQHVPKYSKPINPEAAEEELLRRDPSRVADLLLNHDEDGDKDDDDDDDRDGATPSKGEQRRVERLLRQQKKEEVYRQVFKRGTSIDDSELEPRMMGLKFSDFRGFGVILDSVGHDEDGHRNQAQQEQQPNGEHAVHEPRITLLLHLPAKEEGGKKPVVNNFDPQNLDFRKSAVRLQCRYDFRQSPTQRAVHMMMMRNGSTTAGDRQPPETAEEELLHRTPENPVELVVRYHDRRLRVMLIREDVSRRRVVPMALEETHRRLQKSGHEEQRYRVEKTAVETLCGEIDNVDLPVNYHFGISASTGMRMKKKTRKTMDEEIGKGEKEPQQKHPRGSLISLFKNTGAKAETDMHVDVHDVISFELRELGTDAKVMGYSKSIPIEHFDYEADHHERRKFSQPIPVEVGE